MQLVPLQRGFVAAADASALGQGAADVAVRLALFRTLLFCSKEIQSTDGTFHNLILLSTHQLMSSQLQLSAHQMMSSHVSNPTNPGSPTLRGGAAHEAPWRVSRTS